MRVVQFCGGFSISSQTFIYDTVTELDRQGEDCHVVAINRENKEERPYGKVHITPRPGRWNVARLWYRILATTGLWGEVETHKRPVLRHRVRGCLENLEPDVVHAQFGPEGVIMGPVTTALDIPLVVTFHGYDVSRLPRREEVRARYQKLFEQADTLIGVSEHNTEKLKALGAPEEKVRTIYNGVQIDQFVYSNPSDRYDKKTVRLLHVGRLVENKGPLELLEAFQIAQKKVGNATELKLTIAGDGPLQSQVSNRIEALGLGDAVECVGAVPHEEVQRLMHESHLYTQHCKTSSSGDQEGQGVTFIEAQASGLPVVATRSGGVPSVVVDGETGYLVPEEDTEAMADRIAYLAQRPSTWEEIGRRGREHVEEHFDLAKQVQKLRELYEQLQRNPCS